MISKTAFGELFIISKDSDEFWCNFQFSSRVLNAAFLSSSKFNLYAYTHMLKQLVALSFWRKVGKQYSLSWVKLYLDAKEIKSSVMSSVLTASAYKYFTRAPTAK